VRQDIHEAKSLHVERRDAERVHINGVSCSYAQCVIHASYTYYVHGRYTIAHRIDNEREFRSAVQDVYDRYTRGETTSEMGLIQLYAITHNAYEYEDYRICPRCGAQANPHDDIDAYICCGLYYVIHILAGTDG